MREILRQKLADATRFPLPGFTPREAELPAVPKKIQAIVGMRRAGKTFYLFQCMQQKLTQGVAREGLVYLNFEDERLAGIEATHLSWLLEEFYLRTPVGGISDGLVPEVGPQSRQRQDQCEVQFAHSGCVAKGGLHSPAGLHGWRSGFTMGKSSKASPPVNVAATNLSALQSVVARPAGRPQTPAAEPVGSGDQVALGSVASEPRLPSLAAPGAEQLARAANTSWQGTASQSLAEFASRYFSSSEFQAFNSGSYHNVDHPLVVAEATGAFAHGLGWSPQRKGFMQQVALLHDADDRSQVGSEDIQTGTPARAQVTLEWMEQQQDPFKQRHGWNDDQLLEAKALIARTDFPFDDKARKPKGTR